MDFYKRIRMVCERIPYGKAATYGQIALLCGKPKNARQVGYALRTQKAGKEIPAYKIVNQKGILSGAEAFETPDMQKALLEQEGILVQWTADGYRIDLSEFGWKNTLKEAEQFRELFKKERI